MQHERKNAQVFCGSTQKTRTDHEKLKFAKFAKSKGSQLRGTFPVNLDYHGMMNTGMKFLHYDETLYFVPLCLGNSPMTKTQSMGEQMFLQ